MTVKDLFRFSVVLPSDVATVTIRRKDKPAEDVNGSRFDWWAFADWGVEFIQPAVVSKVNDLDAEATIGAKISITIREPKND